MILRRGDIAYVAIKGPYTGKPHPVVVVQADEATPFRDSVTICPLTGDLIDAPAEAAGNLPRTSELPACQRQGQEDACDTDRPREGAGELGADSLSLDRRARL